MSFYRLWEVQYVLKSVETKPGDTFVSDETLTSNFSCYIVLLTYVNNNFYFLLDESQLLPRTNNSTRHDEVHNDNFSTETLMYVPEARSIHLGEKYVRFKF